MSRQDQLNTLLKSELAILINREVIIRDSLITVSYAKCSPDLSSAKIGISVLPEKLDDTVIEKLRKHSGKFTKILQKKTKLRRIPRFNWVIDDTERKAAEIDELFKKIEQEEQEK